MPKLSASRRPPLSRGEQVSSASADWEAARLETLALIAGSLHDGGEMQPGDLTARDYALASGMSPNGARMVLTQLVEDGVLVRVEKVRDPRARTRQRVTVWRKKEKS